MHDIQDLVGHMNKHPHNFPHDDLIYEVNTIIMTQAELMAWYTVECGTQAIVHETIKQLSSPIKQIMLKNFPSE